MDNQPPIPGAPFPPAPNFPPSVKPAAAGPAPGPAFPPPGGIKFPVKSAGGGAKPLVLPRRASPLQRAQEASQATAAARKSIDAIMSSSRAPWGGKAALSGSQVEELEKALRALEAKASEREMALAEAENKLAERDRMLAETEALLQAREKVIDAMRKQPAPEAGGAVNPAEMEALSLPKEELDRQEASLKEARQALAEREEFLNQSEAALFEKMQAQQEKETELEQKAEDIKRAMQKAGLAGPDPKQPIEKA